MNLVELQNKIHAQNKELGWWNKERPFSTFVCLFHSELSEAMEGDRKGLMDDHLPQYPMFQVELADFVIRCLDWLGSVSFGCEISTDGDMKFYSICDYIAEMHLSISLAFRPSLVYSDRSCTLIVEAVEMAFHCAKMESFDLNQIILEKVEYNKHRADHKPSERAKKHGKKY